jgi:hypothetical protein
MGLEPDATPLPFALVVEESFGVNYDPPELPP